MPSFGIACVNYIGTEESETYTQFDGSLRPVGVECAVVDIANTWLEPKVLVDLDVGTDGIDRPGAAPAGIVLIGIVLKPKFEPIVERDAECRIPALRLAGSRPFVRDRIVVTDLVTGGVCVFGTCCPFVDIVECRDHVAVTGDSDVVGLVVACPAIESKIETFDGLELEGA